MFKHWKTINQPTNQPLSVIDLLFDILTQNSLTNDQTTYTQLSTVARNLLTNLENQKIKNRIFTEIQNCLLLAAIDNIPNSSLRKSLNIQH